MLLKKLINFLISITLKIQRISRAPLLSVITVTFNSVQTIERTILSVIYQSFSDYEYLIVDGGSTDGTVDVIKRYQEQIDFFSSESDNGIYDAMNKAAAIASGEFVIYINSGDEILEVDFDFLRSNNSVDVFYGNYLSGDRRIVRPHDLKVISYAMPFCHQAVLVREGLVREYGFNTKFRIAGDFDFFQRLVKEGKEFKYVDVTMAMFEGGGVSSNMSTSYVLEYLEIIYKNRVNYFWPYTLFKFIFILIIDRLKKR